MRRALQTCDIIFRDHPNKPRIVVEPGVREVFSSACDIGTRLRESQAEMPYFDYSRIKNPDIWYLESMKNLDVKEKLMAAIEGVPEGIEQTKRLENAFLEYIKEVYTPERRTSYVDF